jgi:glycine/D-amino acid oxidase-like deaminating enzyme
VPEYADNVKAQPEQIEAMLKVAQTFLALQPGQDLEVLHTGRCYRPLAYPNRPIIGKANWSLLDKSSFELTKMDHNQPPGYLPPRILGGLYVNTAHNSDGITLGPGSGKLMSEYLLGLTPSVATLSDSSDEVGKELTGPYHL